MAQSIVKQLVNCPGITGGDPSPQDQPQPKFESNAFVQDAVSRVFDGRNDSGNYGGGSSGNSSGGGWGNSGGGCYGDRGGNDCSRW